jgi:hypothetical protein
VDVKGLVGECRYGHGTLLFIALLEHSEEERFAVVVDIA